MSKTITAAAVLQLVERKKIGLDDSIDRYVGVNPYDPAITVRELVSHTSGIPNPIPLRWVHPMTRHASFDERAALAAVLLKHTSLSFRPGTRYGYSNIGYWLLGRIIEHASDQRFDAYVTDHVLRPLGISPEDLAYTITDPARHAVGYLEKYSFMNLAKRFVIDRDLLGDYEGRWLQIRGHYLNGPAFGGLVGTARGFGRFLQDQLREHSALFNDSTRSLFYTQQRTTRGTPVAMTLGWHIGKLNDVGFFYKEGGGGGFHSMMRLYPAVGLATIVMSNATAFDVAGCLDAVDAQFLSAAAVQARARLIRERLV